MQPPARREHRPVVRMKTVRQAPRTTAMPDRVEMLVPVPIRTRQKERLQRPLKDQRETLDLNLNNNRKHKTRRLEPNEPPQHGQHQTVQLLQRRGQQTKTEIRVGKQMLRGKMYRGETRQMHQRTEASVAEVMKVNRRIPITEARALQGKINGDDELKEQLIFLAALLILYIFLLIQGCNPRRLLFATPVSLAPSARSLPRHYQQQARRKEEH